MQDCWNSSGREMERGADILTEKKHGGQCGYCHTDFEIEVLVYVQERTLKGKFKQEMLICPECVKKIEGGPRYSVEELDELISKILAAELDSDLELILHVADTVELDKFWNGIGPNNDDSFKDLLKNSKKVKELLEQPVKPSKGLAGLFD